MEHINGLLKFCNIVDVYLEAWTTEQKSVLVDLMIAVPTEAVFELGKVLSSSPIAQEREIGYDLLAESTKFGGIEQQDIFIQASWNESEASVSASAIEAINPERVYINERDQVVQELIQVAEFHPHPETRASALIKIAELDDGPEILNRIEEALTSLRSFIEEIITFLY